jgi:hypothetical protein
VAAKEIAVKKDVVRLSGDERAQLNDLIHNGRRSAQAVDQRRILLKADVSEAGEGWSNCRIAQALDTSIANILRTRRRLVEEGFEAVLTRPCPILSSTRPAPYLCGANNFSTASTTVPLMFISQYLMSLSAFDFSCPT